MVGLNHMSKEEKNNNTEDGYSYVRLLQALSQSMQNYHWM